MGNSYIIAEGSKPLSNNKVAIRRRLTTMLNDELNAKRAESSIKSHRRQAHKRVVLRIKDQNAVRLQIPKNGTISTRLINIVKFHLAKHRDAGDIAVRENIPISLVLTAINAIHE